MTEQQQEQANLNKTADRSLFSKGLIKVLTEMCNRVGADYEKVNFSKDFWYTDFEWTREEEIEFQKWLAHTTDSEIIYDFFGRKVSQKRKDQMAEYFVNVYGWKLKELN